MKALLLLLGLTVAQSDMSPLPVNLQCGIPPIPPIGCDRDDAVCVCDRNGNCQWLWQCD